MSSIDSISHPPLSWWDHFLIAIIIIFVFFFCWYRNGWHWLCAISLPDVTVSVWQRTETIRSELGASCWIVLVSFELTSPNTTSSSGTWRWIYRPLAKRNISIKFPVEVLPIFNLSSSSENTSDLRLFIRPEEEADFDGYHVELFRHEVKDVDLLSCHETDDPMNEHLTIDSSVQWMTFRNRSDGYYCVVVIPEDDRCHPTSVDLDRTCARHSNLIHIKGFHLSFPISFLSLAFPTMD